MDGGFYTMRGRDMSHVVAKGFQDLAPKASVVAIGDGGNEFGMGSVRDRVVPAIPDGEKVACVVPSDVCIVGSVSNWAADALCVALNAVEPRAAVLTSAEETEIAERLFALGVRDGFTMKVARTVDGFPLEKSIEVLEELKAIVASHR